MAKPFDSVGVLVTAVGSVFIYAGIKGYSLLAVIQNLVTGKPITTNVVAGAVPLTDPTAPVVTADSGVGSGNLNQNVNPSILPPGNLSGVKAIANSIAQQYGWDVGQQWVDLVSLWEQESSWNNRSMNSQSGAYGIPQALPYTKMPKQGWPESAGGESDPGAQISWGLSYIKGRYGSPSAAWAHEKSSGWY